MVDFFVILIVFFLFIQAASYKYEFEGKKVQVCFGTEKNCYPFIISTKVPKVYILNKQTYQECFDPGISSTFWETSVSISSYLNDDYYHGKFVRDNLIIPTHKITLHNFTFILVDKGVRYTNYCGVLGIANDVSMFSSDSDFLNEMVKLNYLSSIKIIITSSMLALDDNEVKITRKKNITPLKMKYKKSLFAILSAQSIFINFENDMSYLVGGNFIFFRTDSRKSYIPKEMFDHIAEAYFKDLGEEKICNLVKTNVGKKIRCRKGFDMYYDMSSVYIYIFIQRWSLKICLGDMLLYDPGAKTFDLLLEFSENDSMDFVLGTAVLDKYKIEIDEVKNIVSFSKGK